MRRLLPVATATVLLLAACGSGEPEVGGPTLEPVPSASAPDSPSPSPSPTPAPSPDASPSPSPSPALSPTPTSGLEGLLTATPREVEVPQDVFVLGASPDGTNLHAFAPDEDGFRCEESPPSSLQLLDVDDGGLRRAVTEPDLPVDVLVPRTDGTWLALAGCEGFLGLVAVVDVAPDGTVTLRREVDLTGVDVFGVSAVAPVPGRDVLAVARFREAGGSELLTIGLDGVPLGDPVPLEEEVYRLWATSGGVYGTSFGAGSGDSVVELGGQRRYPGYDDAVPDADGERLLVTGDAGVAVVGPDGSLDRWVDDAIGDEVRWSGPAWVGEDRVLAVRDPFGEAVLELVGPGGPLLEVVRDAADFPPPALVAGGTRLVLTVYDDVDLAPDVLLLDQP